MQLGQIVADGRSVSEKRLFDPDTLECLLPKLVHPTLEPPKIHALMSVDDIYDQADQGLLECLKEDKRLERKPANLHHAVLKVVGH